jgi:glycosyltransferase involved in cell wall biosynthesis
VSDLATFLASRHEVRVFTGSRYTLAGVRTVRIPSMPKLPHDARAPVKAAWHLGEQWIPSVHTHLARELESFAPDVVNTHEVQGLSAGVFTSIAAGDYPHVHFAHDLTLLCVRATMARDGRFCGGNCSGCRLQRTIRRFAIRRRLDYLIAPSHSIANRHVAAGVVDESRARKIRLGAPPGRARLRVPSGTLRVGFIGTLVDVKGVPLILSVAGRLPPGVELHIAGDGPLRELVETASAANERIHYHGQVLDEAREAFFDAIDVVLVPSQYEEAGPLMMAEVSVRGIPAIVSDRGGLPEWPNLAVVRSDSENDWARELAAIRDQPERVATLSQTLLDAHESFLWDKHAAGIEELLVAAIDERR